MVKLEAKNVPGFHHFDIIFFFFFAIHIKKYRVKREQYSITVSKDFNQNFFIKMYSSYMKLHLFFNE